jgi:solute:Na+ symporter, SSS family
MNIATLDIVLFVIFYATVISVSLWKSRRERNSADYFLAGRGLTWPLIGISIVAANLSTEQFVGMAGQGAGKVGLAVSSWQLVGSVGIVIIAFTFLPRFLRAGIYTLPEFLEYRYNPTARAIMALLTVVIYVVVLLAAVLYSGGLTLETIFELESNYGFPLSAGIWAIGALAALYTVWGGLKAVAWADLFQGLALLFGGFITFYLGLKACGGWASFATENADKLHMVLPAKNEDLPWTGVVSGMWIVIIYYCGLNQFIVQRNLAAKTLRDGQLGMIFAGGLWLLVPFAVVMPGIMALQLYGEQLGVNTDRAYPTLIRELIPEGIRGFMFAAIAGAVVSSLASMLNSASTIFTMDIYKRLLAPEADERSLLWVGRVVTLLALIGACMVAPQLANPKFGGVFQFIQQFQGYIWPGVVAAFVMAFVLPRAPGMAGVVALLVGPVLYGAFQFTAKSESRPWGHELHFLIQVFGAFMITAILMGIITWLRPLAAPQKLPIREDIAISTETPVKVAGALVIAGVAVFYFIFW